MRHVFGAIIDQPTTERWSSLLAFGHAIDDYVDLAASNPENFKSRTDEVLELLSRPEEVERRFPALSLEAMGPRTYGRLARLGKVVVRDNIRIKTAPTVTEYAQLRRKEGRDYARLVTSVATADVASQPAYQRFSRWFVDVGDAANIFNSLHGLRGDAARGEIAFIPTLSAHAHLIGVLGVQLAHMTFGGGAQPIVPS